MFKKLGWADLLIGIVVGVSAGLILLNQGITDDFLARLDVAATAVLSGALVWVTWRYVRETTKMAEASEKQVMALQSQLDLETAPKLLAVLSAPQPASAAVYVNLVNLGRHQLWVTNVASDIEPDSRPDQAITLHGGKAITPGSPASIGMYKQRKAAEKVQGEVKVHFYYGPTGSKLHSKVWLLTLDGENAAIKEL